MKGMCLRAAWNRARVGGRGALLALLLAGPLPAQGAELAGQDLADMDLEELMEIEVTSVSKRAQKLSHAPAAITVITEEDIRRSGVLTLPDLLRMVPGLHVAQIDATHWSVSSRGFADEFSNKLLVLIDGRTVYEPIFSGVLWNQHDVMLEDIQRIEVVRGPGGTLWGANAVNGVINIITKSAKDTQGLLLSTQAGSYEVWDGAARYGFSAGEDVHARFYAKYALRRDFEDPSSGAPADDNWQSIRTGGRIDWDLAERTLLTLQGDWFDTQADRVIIGGLPDEEENGGGNILFRATHGFSDTHSLSFQAYYDRTDRDWLLIAEERDTYDVEFQHAISPFERYQLIWGAGYRRNNSDTEGSVALNFNPPHRQDDLWSLFLQNDIALIEDLLSVGIGSKFEKNDYTGWEFQPSGRVLLTPSDRYSAWAAISRAVRSPSRVEEDVFFILPPNVVLGSEGVDSEDLLAYELGFRARLLDPLTVDIATYYNDYDDLRTTEAAVFPTLVMDNEMEGASYGVELSTTWSVTSYWRLTGNYTYTKMDLDGGSLLSEASADQLEDLTPRHQFSLRSNLNLPWNVAFDTMLYWVDRLPDQGVDAYARLDLRLAWEPFKNRDLRWLDDLELSVVGLNVAEEHREFPSGIMTQASRVPRSVYGSVRWSFR